MFLNKQKIIKLVLTITLVMYSIFTLFHSLGKENINVDQFLWKSRTENFFTALLNNDYKGTLQQYHPGVSFMYLIKLGYISYNINNTEFKTWRELKNENFIELNANIKLIIQLFNLILIVICSYLVYKLFGYYTSILFYTLTVSETYFIGILRNLHLDGMVALIILGTILSYLVFLENGSKKYLISAIILGGLGLLTKSISIFSFFSIGLISLFYLVNNEKNIFYLFKALIVYLFGSLIVFSCLFPAMWQDPLNTLNRIFIEGTFGVGLSGEDNFGHHLSDGISTKNPGYLFYFTVIYFRFSNFLFALLVLLILHILIINFKIIKIIDNLKFPRLFYYIFPIPFVYLFIITYSTKKTDRYLSVFIIFIILLISIYTVSLINKYKNKLLIYTLSLLLISNVVVNFLIHPYYFAHYNPLLGGVNKAKKFIYINQGGIAFIEVLNYIDSLDINSTQKVGIFNYEEFAVASKTPIYSLEPTQFKLRYIRVPTLQRGRNLLSNTNKIYTFKILGQPWWEVYRQKDK